MARQAHKITQDHDDDAVDINDQDAVEVRKGTGNVKYAVCGKYTSTKGIDYPVVVIRDKANSDDFDKFKCYFVVEGKLKSAETSKGIFIGKGQGPILPDHRLSLLKKEMKHDWAERLQHMFRVEPSADQRTKFNGNLKNLKVTKDAYVALGVKNMEQDPDKRAESVSAWILARSDKPALPSLNIDDKVIEVLKAITTLKHVKDLNTLLLANIGQIISSFGLTNEQVKTELKRMHQVPEPEPVLDTSAADELFDF